MLAFSDSLHEQPATLNPSAKFRRQWKDLLIWHATKEREWLLGNSVSAKVVDRLIQLRWAVLDRKRNAYDYLEKKPPDRFHPIPIIVVNWHGTWDLSPALRATVIQHPIYRALQMELPDSAPKNELMQLMRWAMSLSDSHKDEERLLSSLAHECDALIHDVDRFGFTGHEWLLLARENEDFWTLLQKTLDLGRRHAIWQIYRDGSLQKSSRRGALMVTKVKGEWRHVIDEAIRQHHENTGVWISPAKLRKEFGAPAVAPKSRLQFTDPELVKMPPITWQRFQSRAKKALAEQKNRAL